MTVKDLPKELVLSNIMSVTHKDSVLKNRSASCKLYFLLTSLETWIWFMNHQIKGQINKKEQVVLVRSKLYGYRFSKGNWDSVQSQSTTNNCGPLFEDNLYFSPIRWLKKPRQWKVSAWMVLGSNDTSSESVAPSNLNGSTQVN